MNLMRAIGLSGYRWGASKKALLYIYKSLIKSVNDYGARIFLQPGGLQFSTTFIGRISDFKKVFNYSELIPFSFGINPNFYGFNKYQLTLHLYLHVVLVKSISKVSKGSGVTLV